MRKLHILFMLFVLSFVLLGCNGYRETSHGIVAGVVKVEPLSEGVIRVCATDSRFYKTENPLISYEYPEEKFWKVLRQDDGSVAVVTSKVMACIDISTGNVTFKDPSGTVLLKEKSRVFDGSIRQIWESDGDESFYGFNNCPGVAKLPVVVSTDNYGILWSSNSAVRWGDAREHLQLNELFRVYDEAGAQGGLSGSYRSASGGKFYRSEPFLYFENDGMNVELLPDFPLDGSVVTFNGALEPNQSGLYGFKIHYSGYIDVFVDDNLLIPERWHPCDYPSDIFFTYPMEKEKRTPVRIVWRPDGKNAYCSLRAVSPLPSEEDGTVSFWSESGRQIEYFFVAGNDMDDVVRGYRPLLSDSHASDSASHERVALRWEEMHGKIAEALNLSLAGNSHWTLDFSDAGVEKRFSKALKESLLPEGEVGEELNEWHELLARWYQLGVYCPGFRGISFNDPSFSAEPYERSRSRLSKYLSSCGIMMRPLAMDFGYDGNVLDVVDQYMFGKSMMVCPICSFGVRSRNVYLPENEGGWYDFNTGAFRKGGSSVEVYAPLEQIPLFSPAGAIIPLCEDSFTELDVFSGKDGSFSLNGVDSSTIDINYTAGSSELRFSERKGSKGGSVPAESFKIRYYTPYGVRISYVEYSNKELTVLL